MKQTNKARFIVLEGPDRVGKATQTRLLHDLLSSEGYKSSCFEVPLKSNFIYHLIYWMLKNGLAKKLPNVFQWLQYFNRQIFQWIVLPKIENKFDFIIMDRWSLSTVVYGKATGISEKFTSKLYERLKKPDLTVILLGASHEHDAEDVYEADNLLQSSVRRFYQEWADKNEHDSIVLNCRQPREDILQKIRNRLM